MVIPRSELPSGPAGIDMSEKAVAFAHAPGGRHIPLDGAFNFRDVGGLATGDGGTMRSGMLILGRYGTAAKYLSEACGVGQLPLSNLERWPRG